MEYISSCPKCNKPQSRWEILEPFPGFINQCSTCGSDYKTSKLSCFIGAFFGLIIVADYIMADKEIIQWPIALIAMLSLLLVTIITSPYYTKLIEAPEQHRNIMRKWMLPFIRWQVFIAALVIIIIAGNLFISTLNDKRMHSYYILQENTKNIESSEKLKVLAEHNIASLFSELTFQDILIRFNVRISYLLLLLLSLNVVFYFKISHSHNKSLNLTGAKDAPPS